MWREAEAIIRAIVAAQRFTPIACLIEVTFFFNIKSSFADLLICSTGLEVSFYP